MTLCDFPSWLRRNEWKKNTTCSCYPSWACPLPESSTVIPETLPVTETQDQPETCANWTVEDETELIKFLITCATEGGDGTNFNGATWTAAAKAINEYQTRGAPKNSSACKNKFAFVCDLGPFSTDWPFLTILTAQRIVPHCLSSPASIWIVMAWWKGCWHWCDNCWCVDDICCSEDYYSLSSISTVTHY